MDSNGPVGVSQAPTQPPLGSLECSTGDVDLNGELVGRLRENGTAHAARPWHERPGFHERMEAAGQDPEAMRRMVAAGGAVLS